LPTKPNGQTVPVLLSSQSAPFWLLRLCALQRRFSVVTFLLVTAMLTVYGWTVYSQRMESSIQQASNLTTNERQLTTTRSAEKPDGAASRTIGYRASAAKSGSGDFLKPEPQRSNHPTERVPSATKSVAQTEKKHRFHWATKGAGTGAGEYGREAQRP